MNALWTEIEAQLEISRTEPLSMAALCAALRRPPFGMRTRSLSLIISAVMRESILKGNISFEIRKSGTLSKRISKIDGIVLDDVISSANDYSLVYMDIGEKQRAILFGVANAFGVEPSKDTDVGDLIETVQSTVTNWWRGLPVYTQRTDELDPNTIWIRDEILLPLSREHGDPHEILLEKLPLRVFPAEGKETISHEAISELFSQSKDAIENAIQASLIPRIEAAISEVFSSKKGAKKKGISTIGAWFDDLPSEQQDVRMQGDPLILAKIASALSEERVDGEEATVQLSEEVIGLPLKSWDEEIVQRPQGRLEGAKKTIELAEPAIQHHEQLPGQDMKGQIRIQIISDSASFTRTFIPTKDISNMGENLRNIINGALQGMGKTLPAGECETILMEIIREVLQ